VEPELRDLDQDPELHAEYRAWRERRDEFMARHRSGDPETIKQDWQKLFFEGKYPDGTPTQAPHTARLDLAEPRDLRARKPTPCSMFIEASGRR
jgi:uncharacterized protein DUF6065